VAGREVQAVFLSGSGGTRLGRVLPRVNPVETVASKASPRSWYCNQNVRQLEAFASNGNLLCQATNTAGHWQPLIPASAFI
jgi:hypothetical protein